MSRTSLPFFTAYDPIGASEGTLDPMGLYQIADQLAVQLVPAVRERMQRIRFLTAIAVGTRVLDGLDSGSDRSDSAPFLVWEWLVIEAFVRAGRTVPVSPGTAGVQVVRRAINKFGYVDAATYLKTPRVFGFHGIYKRLAVHLGITDVHFAAREQGEALFHAWADDYADGGRAGALRLVERCTIAVRRGWEKRPPRTAAPFGADEWAALARALSPDAIGRRERRLLRDLLLQPGAHAVGALAPVWHCLEGLEGKPDQEVLDKLMVRAPEYGPLLTAIRAYERFARALQDAFDCLRHSADGEGMLSLSEAGARPEFAELIRETPALFAVAVAAFGADGLPQRAAFSDRFAAFGVPLTPVAFATELLAHHARIQRDKAAGGKRAWFDVVDDERRYWRPNYRLPEWEPRPEAFVHDYRCAPIGRFRADLT